VQTAREAAKPADIGQAALATGMRGQSDLCAGGIEKAA